MADNNKSKALPTHTAFAFKREGRKFGRWLEIGVARAEADGAIRVFIDRLPTGGFTGGVLLSPIGTMPEMPEPPPRRPGQVDEDDELDS
jgi:hypothetical protein